MPPPFFAPVLPPLLPLSLPHPSPAGSGWERVCNILRCKVCECVRGAEGGKDSRGSRGCPGPPYVSLPGRLDGDRPAP